MDFAVTRKLFGIALILCTLAAACSRNVEPGDAQYPVLKKSPQRPLDITLIQAPTVKAGFTVEWYAAYSKGANESKCTFSGYDPFPVRVPYSFTMPLSFVADGAGLHSNFAFDMYEPGLCGYKFVALTYRVGPQTIPAQLIQYRDDPSLPNDASVDLWCYPMTGSPVDYWCDSMSAASSQNIGHAEQYRLPRLPTPEQAAAARANGDREPPALVGPNTHSLVIRVHDARIN
jgi:hypothetical protein